MKVYLNNQFFETDSVTIVAEKGMKTTMHDFSGIFYEAKVDKTTNITVQEELITAWGVLPNVKTPQTDKQETLFPEGFERDAQAPR